MVKRENWRRPNCESYPPALNNLMLCCFQPFSVHPHSECALFRQTHNFLVDTMQCSLEPKAENPYITTEVILNHICSCFCWRRMLRMWAPTRWDWKCSGLWGRLYSLQAQSGRTGLESCSDHVEGRQKQVSEKAGKHCENDTDAIRRVSEHSDSCSHLKAWLIVGSWKCD